MANRSVYEYDVGVPDELVDTTGLDKIIPNLDAYADPVGYLEKSPTHWVLTNLQKPTLQAVLPRDHVITEHEIEAAVYKVFPTNKQYDQNARWSAADFLRRVIFRNGNRAVRPRPVAANRSRNTVSRSPRFY